MSLEAIKSIAAAEAQALQAKHAAKEKAAIAIAEAEKNGKETLEKTRAKAEAEVALLIRETDTKAAHFARELASSTANRQATLRARAEARLARTAQLIAERIVSS